MKNKMVDIILLPIYIPLAGLHAEGVLGHPNGILGVQIYLFIFKRYLMQLGKIYSLVRVSHFHVLSNIMLDSDFGHSVVYD